MYLSKRKQKNYVLIIVSILTTGKQTTDIEKEYLHIFTELRLKDLEDIQKRDQGYTKQWRHEDPQLSKLVSLESSILAF